ncbi:MAG: pyrroline-5-carboxylate reductase [Prevotellaceae bacterium]|jgi:pyrroline-5-carboxylate reductase|nr:pyrroline-5-carboxylate reductase [Prevotellaceae bacterium]
MKITVIGAGNIGGAIVEGAVKQGILTSMDIAVSDPHPNVKERFLSKNIVVNHVNNNAVAVEGADLIIVAVKPWLVEGVMNEISGAINRDKQAVVSIAAGVAFAQITQYLSVADKGQAEIYRIIPNTAISLGKSVSFIAKHNTSAKHDEQVHTLFEALGEIFYIEEHEMTACTALASAGIAYALRYIDAAMRGGEALGLDKNISLRIVMKTVEGALALLDANNAYPQTEIDKVTTPGGVTLKGLEKMENGGFSQAVIDGLTATK